MENRVTEKLIMENGRIKIRDLQKTDLDDLLRLTSDPDVYRYEPTYLPEKLTSPESLIEEPGKMNLWKDRQCVLAIIEKSDQGHGDRFVGLAEFYDYKPSGKVISIGYRLAKAYWGRGIGSECVGMMTGFLRSNTQVEMVTAHVIPDNAASARVLLKNKFELLLTKEEDWGYPDLTTADVYVLDLEPEGQTPAS